MVIIRILPKSPMIETNIWLDKEDKQVLTKKAQQKQLSLSTFIDIITNEYIFGCYIPNEYLHKGKKQTHIKIKNHNKHELTPTIITNCVYIYLHHEKHPKYKELKEHLTKLDRKIQSKADKTTDNFYLGNQIIRSQYYLQQKRQNKQC